jgi:hypothetical protein
MAGSCYLSLADTRRAQVFLEDTAAALGDGSKSQAVVLANLALALIRQGELDTAAGRLHQARRGVASTVAGRFRLRPRPASGHAEGPCGESAARERVDEKKNARLRAWPRIGHASPAKHDKTGTAEAQKSSSKYAG